MRLELDLLERAQAMNPDAKVKAEGLLKKMAEEEARYNKEKKEIEQEARKLGHERDVNRAKDPYFDYAEILLQIAIVMSSVAILSASRPVFAFSIVAAVLGALFFLKRFPPVDEGPLFPLTWEMGRPI